LIQANGDAYLTSLSFLKDLSRLCMAISLCLSCVIGVGCRQRPEPLRSGVEEKLIADVCTKLGHRNHELQGRMMINATQLPEVPGFIGRFYSVSDGAIPTSYFYYYVENDRIDLVSQPGARKVGRQISSRFDFGVLPTLDSLAATEIFNLLMKIEGGWNEKIISDASDIPGVKSMTAESLAVLGLRPPKFLKDQGNILMIAYTWSYYEGTVLRVTMEITSDGLTLRRSDVMNHVGNWFPPY
jgi:hypothetical protein